MQRVRDHHFGLLQKSTNQNGAASKAYTDDQAVWDKSSGTTSRYFETNKSKDEESRISSRSKRATRPLPLPLTKEGHSRVLPKAKATEPPATQAEEGTRKSARQAAKKPQLDPEEV